MEQSNFFELFFLVLLLLQPCFTWTNEYSKPVQEVINYWKWIWKLVWKMSERCVKSFVNGGNKPVFNLLFKVETIWFFSSNLNPIQGVHIIFYLFILWLQLCTLWRVYHYDLETKSWRYSKLFRLFFCFYCYYPCGIPRFSIPVYVWIRLRKNRNCSNYKHKLILLILLTLVKCI